MLNNKLKLGHIRFSFLNFTFIPLLCLNKSNQYFQEYTELLWKCFYKKNSEVIYLINIEQFSCYIQTRIDKK